MKDDAISDKRTPCQSFYDALNALDTGQLPRAFTSEASQYTSAHGSDAARREELRTVTTSSLARQNAPIPAIFGRCGALDAARNPSEDTRSRNQKIPDYSNNSNG